MKSPISPMSLSGAPYTTHHHLQPHTFISISLNPKRSFDSCNAKLIQQILLPRFLSKLFQGFGAAAASTSTVILYYLFQILNSLFRCRNIPILFINVDFGYLLHLCLLLLPSLLASLLRFEIPSLINFLLFIKYLYLIQ